MLSTFYLEVLGSVGVSEFKPESFGDEDVDVGIEPVVGWEVLQEKHQALNWIQIDN